MCTYTSLDTNEMNNLDTTQMNIVDNGEMNADKVNALSFL